MPEGGIYLCEWAAADGEYRLRLRSNPDLQASGPDIDECMEEICMQIIEWNGDGEAVLELFPPHRGESFPGGAIVFARVGYTDRSRAADYEQLFEGRACPVCKFGLGVRSDAPLRLESQPEGMVCGVTGCYPILQIYHREFVNMLADKELSAVELRPVYQNDQETDYVEVIARKTIPTVGYRGANYPTSFQRSFRCGECGHEKFVVDAENINYGTSFIDIDDIRADTSAMIVVDDGWCQSLAFLLSRWRQLLDQTERHALTSNPLAVLDSDHVERPALEECTEFDWIM
ncbi:MAG: hypothetical protein QNI99_03935 [Woeseiaceae bacterium]|nr:hypothetical protein [Woeseiaceae bacterium]